jgi:hypothetical protein
MTQSELAKKNRNFRRLSNMIYVKAIGRFKKDFNKNIKKGKKVVIDRIKYSPITTNYLFVRVINLWKKPAWFNAGWFKFDKI